jgi:hypothetical protein
MTAITQLVAEIREEAPPAVRFDPRQAGLSEIGRPSVVEPPAGESA